MAILVGLTGGMGSGKSTVSRLLKSRGAYVIDADQVCRDLVEPGQPALNEIVQSFGTKVINQEGGLDRKKMADLIFADPEKKTILENILHPRVFEEERKLYEQIISHKTDAVVIIDAALLIESGNYRKVDKVVLVRCNETQQIERIRMKGQWDQEDIFKRLKNQMPQEEKAKFADLILDNDSTLSDLEQKVDDLYQQLSDAGKLNRP